MHFLPRSSGNLVLLLKYHALKPCKLLNIKMRAAYLIESAPSPRWCSDNHPLCGKPYGRSVLEMNAGQIWRPITRNARISVEEPFTVSSSRPEDRPIWPPSSHQAALIERLDVFYPESSLLARSAGYMLRPVSLPRACYIGRRLCTLGTIETIRPSPLLRYRSTLSDHSNTKATLCCADGGHATGEIERYHAHKHVGGVPQSSIEFKSACHRQIECRHSVVQGRYIRRVRMAAAETSVDIGKTYGALLFGAGIAFSLSGVVATQCIVYFKQYPGDSNTKKAMVLASWILDGLHTSFLMYTIHEYFISSFGDLTRIDYIPWALAISVVITALQTLLVHCFFAHKIFRSSGGNWLITCPIVLLAIARLCSACITTVNMIRLQQFHALLETFPRTMFTTGLSLTAAVDILITFWLCYFLAQFRAGISPMSTMMIRMVDTLTLYTLENGALTCFAAIASLVCWLTMPHNLIFMGLHFVISKLYANSFLASLNMRHQLRQIHGLDPPEGYPSGYYRNPGKGRQGPGHIESDLLIQNSRPDHHAATKLSLDDRIHIEGPEDVQLAHLGRQRRPSDPKVIQFRPASSYYWNVIARSAKPVEKYTRYLVLLDISAGDDVQVASDIPNEEVHVCFTGTAVYQHQKTSTACFALAQGSSSCYELCTALPQRIPGFTTWEPINALSPKLVKRWCTALHLSARTTQHGQNCLFIVEPPFTVTQKQILYHRLFDHSAVVVFLGCRDEGQRGHSQEDKSNKANK
ncbi:hypothetical protein NMY22_g14134 [Coprinellus aureogranulatus]|nr:hypothetical protein NMY22_g14134 [Coprinellus aureogranulatus]